jgi:hypothetical protein
MGIQNKDYSSQTYTVPAFEDDYPLIFNMYGEDMLPDITILNLYFDTEIYIKFNSIENEPILLRNPTNEFISFNLNDILQSYPFYIREIFITTSNQNCTIDFLAFHRR